MGAASAAHPWADIGERGRQSRWGKKNSIENKAYIENFDQPYRVRFLLQMSNPHDRQANRCWTRITGLRCKGLIALATRFQERGRAGHPVVRQLARAVHHRGLHGRGLPFAVPRSGVQARGGHQENGWHRGGLRQLHDRPAEQRHGRGRPVGDERYRAAHGPPVHRHVRGVQRECRVKRSRTDRVASPPVIVNRAHRSPPPPTTPTCSDTV